MISRPAADTLAVPDEPTAATNSRLTRWRPSRSSALPYLSLAIAVAATLRTTQGLFLRQDANFDMLHYHAYTGWALFHDGLSRDLHAASGGSYLNPALEVINYVALSLVPASVGTAFLMAIQLSSAIPLYLMTRLLVPRLPRPAALAVAVLSLGGALVTSEWGTTFGDLTDAPPVLWGLWLLLSSTASSRWRLLLGGGLVGAATGLKMTTAPVAVASVVMALILLPRIPALFRWFTGLGVGFLVAAGPWMIVMWKETRNPIFPLLNGIFGSPYAPVSTVRDTRFGAHGLGDVLLMPFKLVAAPAGFSSELPSSDWRWPVWAFSIVIVAVVVALQLPGSPLSRAALPRAWNFTSGPLRKLIALQMLCAVSFALWAKIFGIQRYAIVIEMLTVPVVVATLALLTARRAVLMSLLVVFSIGLGLNTQTLNWGRVAMPDGPAVPQGSVPSLQKYDGIILATPPISYVAVTVGGDAASGTRPAWFSPPFSPTDAKRGLDRLPEGRIGVLVRADAGESRPLASAAAAEFGLRTTGTCRQVTVPPLATIMVICEAVSD